MGAVTPTVGRVVSTRPGRHGRVSRTTLRRGARAVTLEVQDQEVTGSWWTS